MSKIFSKNQGPAVDIKRNTFDLSFASHVTGKIGDLIPVYCQEVIPGDSFEIDPKFGLRFNPTVFPIQSKMHGIMHFFYVRNRNLMTKWPEYIGRTDDSVTMPWLKITEQNAKDIIGTGSLGDYLGVPSTVTGEYARKLTVTLDTMLIAEQPLAIGNVDRQTSITSGTFPSATFGTTALQLVNRKSPNFLYFGEDVYEGAIETSFVNSPFIANWHNSGSVSDEGYNNPSWHKFYGYMSRDTLNHPISRDTVIDFNGTVGLGETDLELPKGCYIAFNIGVESDSPLNRTQNLCLLPVEMHYEASKHSCQATLNAVAEQVYDRMIEAVNGHLGTNSVYLGLVFDSQEAGCADFLSAPSVLPTDSAFKSPADSLTFDVAGLQVLDSTDTNTVMNNPFVTHTNIGQNTPKIKLNALPFRAYESIYNYFYRDETVDPFKINGKEVYNDFIPTHAGGADTTVYRIHQKNWERDYFTSCQTSPQQGVAPLVGISANGTFTFDDGTNEYTASMSIGDDGETITGISTYSPDMPKGSLRQLMDVVTNGLNINDLRNVNSFVRWLETNIRRGYKYVDQIYSHFGVNPAFKANDCPEFIGGIHAVGDVNQVNDTTSQGLGNYGGQLSMFGGSDNKVHCYCDEHGYIIGIMCVFPEPVYSQMLPKHFIKTVTPLDYFFPEFGHIGMQPVTYNEVAPLEVAASDSANSTDTLNDVFGYQRAWADYLANNDQTHGDFRTSMSEYVVSRVFNDKPELGHDFIAIDADDINDIFISTDDNDKMLGEIRFDIKAKRPIPQYGIPRLE